MSTLNEYLVLKRPANLDQLSGGIAQRASFVRAQANGSQFLMFNEPQGKVDSLPRLAMPQEIAALLADRLPVLSGVAASIRADIRVELVRPCRRDDPGLDHLRDETLALLGLAEPA